MVKDKKVIRTNTAFQLRSTNASRNSDKAVGAVPVVLPAIFCRLSTMVVIRLFLKRRNENYP